MIEIIKGRPIICCPNCGAKENFELPMYVKPVHFKVACVGKDGTANIIRCNGCQYQEKLDGFLQDHIDNLILQKGKKK
jgi:hypothetical protein